MIHVNGKLNVEGIYLPASTPLPARASTFRTHFCQPQRKAQGLCAGLQFCTKSTQAASGVHLSYSTSHGCHGNTEEGTRVTQVLHPKPPTMII